jgi:ABC-type sugar transport system permease subunit
MSQKVDNTFDLFMKRLTLSVLKDNEKRIRQLWLTAYFAILIIIVETIFLVNIALMLRQALQ